MRGKNISGHMSIGDLSASCGIAVETLRNWEKRYGFPEPERLESGHRRYNLTLIPRLRKIRTLVQSGFKPSFAVEAEEKELDGLLLTLPHNEDATEASTVDTDPLMGCLSLVRQMDGIRLLNAFHHQWHARGARGFVFDFAVSWLRDLGKLWEEGTLTVAHEHFASEVLHAFLAGQWRQLMQPDSRLRFVLATPEGDRHSLGLQMTAVLTALRGITPLYIGADTPVADVVTAERQNSAAAVVIGLSTASDPGSSADYLYRLREALPDTCIVYGGSNRVTLIDGVEFIESLEDYDAWCESFRHLR